MTSDTVINGKEVELAEERVMAERVMAESFHKDQVAFAIVPISNANILVFNENYCDDRDHMHWLMEDYGISSEVVESVVRGYIKPGRIQLYTGSDFKCIDLQKVTLTDLERLEYKHNKHFRAGEIEVFNGVEVGRVGELWEPKELVFTIK